MNVCILIMYHTEQKHKEACAMNGSLLSPKTTYPFNSHCLKENLVLVSPFSPQTCFSKAVPKPLLMYVPTPNSTHSLMSHHRKEVQNKTKQSHSLTRKIGKFYKSCALYLCFEFCHWPRIVKLLENYKTGTYLICFTQDFSNIFGRILINILQR